MTLAPKGWLLDTNIVSELRKKARANKGVRAWAETTPPAICFLSMVNIAEIRLGIERTIDPGFRAELVVWLEDGIRPWFGERVLAVDETTLLTWRRLVRDAQKSGYTYSQPDALIAATALVHGLGVVTRNVADFERAGVALANPWMLG